MPLFSRCLPLLFVLSFLARLEAVDSAWTMVITPDNSFGFWVLKDDVPVLSNGMYGWGPKWGGLPGSAAPSSNTRGISGEMTLQADWTKVKLKLHTLKDGDNSVSYQYEMKVDEEQPVLMLMQGLSLAGNMQKGQLVLTDNQDKDSTLPLPWPRIDLPGPELIKRITFKITDVGDISIDINPPCRLHHESNNLRIALAAEHTVKGTNTIDLTYHFPGRVSYICDTPGVNSFIKPLADADWYPLIEHNEPASLAQITSVTDMSSWLDAPAGKHGGVKMVGDHFELTNGTPIKFWGTNLAYASECAPAKPWAEATALRFARFGINAVRLHKFTSPAGSDGIGDPNDATKYLPAGLDRLDYMCSQLKSHGVYYGFSHTYGFVVEPGNKDKLLSYGEIMRNAQGNTYAMINYAEDVQALMIERVVNLLNHKNPYTGQRFAEDPALAYIELQNEDDIFFYTNAGVMDEQHWPIYMAYAKKRFAAWLTVKYQTQEKLQAAWAESLKANELLTTGTVGLQGNPWFFTGVNLKRISPGERVRMLDNAAFFHDIQNQFYNAFAKAIRGTGYQGPLCGSPWQAPPMLPHYYNLHSDYLVGFIDRHDYFGGGFHDTMLAHPGSGDFSAGLQQVIDRPFGVSEWIHVYPSLYSAEAPAIFATYGLGLQGWDASYEFQSGGSHADYANLQGCLPWGVWNADLPNQIGQAPTLARMIYRGDVKEGEIISTRRVSPENLTTGNFDFDDEIQQSGDIKNFASSCPVEALAAGRCVVEFTPTSKPSTFPNMNQYKSGTVITSSTKQLSWDTSHGGFFTVDTEGTKAVVGFAEGIAQHLGDVTITLGTHYASVYLTALAKKDTLATTSSALITAMARSCNSGCQVYIIDQHILNNGHNPVLIEPVKANFQFNKRTIAAVNILDQDGVRTGKTIAVKNNAFSIDGAQDHAFYYEVVFP